MVRLQIVSENRGALGRITSQRNNRISSFRKMARSSSVPVGKKKAKRVQRELQKEATRRNRMDRLAAMGKLVKQEKGQKPKAELSKTKQKKEEWKRLTRGEMSAKVTHASDKKVETVVAEQEEVVVEEDDEEFFKEHEEFSSFLQTMQLEKPKQLLGKKRQKQLEKQERLRKKAMREEKAQMDGQTRGEVDDDDDDDEIPEMVDAPATDEEESNEEEEQKESAKEEEEEDTIPPPPRRKRKGRELEEDFERGNRRWKLKQAEDDTKEDGKHKSALPIKMPDGSIGFVQRDMGEPPLDESAEAVMVHGEERAARLPEQNQGDEQAPANEDDVTEEQNDVISPISGSVDKSRRDEELFADAEPSERARQMDLRLVAKRGAIADLCEGILEQPDVYVLANKDHPKGWSKLAELFDLVRNDPDPRVRLLSMLSQMSVFRDLIPAYRIRLPTSKERSQSVTREVKKVRDYEYAFLTAYQSYLKHLEALVRAGSARWSQPHERDHATHAMRCMGELLVSAPYFNFRSNLLKLLCVKAGSPVSPMREVCCTALGKLFAGADPQGDVILEGVTTLAKLLKEDKLSSPADVIFTFSKLRLSVHEDTITDSKFKQGKKKNGKSQAADDEESESIQSGLKEAEATVDRALLLHCQKEALKEVTIIFFRVLKQTNGHQRLLPATLKGLSKIAHLINLDTVEDVLEELKLLLEATVSQEVPLVTAATQQQQQAELPPLNLEAALNCIVTALRTLHGPGRELTHEDSSFSNFLFQLLPRLASERHGEDNTKLAIECMHAMLIKRREYSVSQVSAFIQRTVTISLSLKEENAAALVAFSRLLLQRYPAAHHLLESEEDKCVGFPAPALNAEGANTHGAWPLAMLKRHWHPVVATQAKACASLQALRLTDEPTRIWSNIQENLLFYPQWRLPTPHPLMKVLRRGQKRGRDERQIFLKVDLPEQTVFGKESDLPGSSAPFKTHFYTETQFQHDHLLRKYGRLEAEYTQWKEQALLKKRQDEPSEAPSTKKRKSKKRG